MSNVITFQFRNPLSLYITGSGEYVRNQVEHLTDLWDLAEFDHEQQIRQDYE